MRKSWRYRRGDIYIADLDPVIGSEQGGKRPVLLLQNDTGNLHGPTLIVAPITSHTDKKPNLPTHCIFEGIPFLLGPSVVMLEQIRTIDKARIRRYLGSLSFAQMAEIDPAIDISLGIHRKEDKTYA